MRIRERLTPGRLAGMAILLLTGVAAVIAGAADDESGSGLSALILSAVLAVGVLLIPKRGDLSSIATGETDERQRSIDLKAQWITLQVVILTTIGGFFWEVAHDRDGTPFLVIALVSTVTYVVALLVLMRRS